MEEKVIDVVLPVHRPGSELKQLIRRLDEQIQKDPVYLYHAYPGWAGSACFACGRRL